jgi:hypothetical protein
MFEQLIDNRIETIFNDIADGNKLKSGDMTIEDTWEIDNIKTKLTCIAERYFRINSNN